MARLMVSEQATDREWDVSVVANPDELALLALRLGERERSIRSDSLTIMRLVSDRE